MADRDSSSSGGKENSPLAAKTPLRTRRDRVTGIPVVVKNGGSISIICQRGGVMVSFDLEPANARRFAAEILEELEKLPKVMCADDLGLEAA